jgi:hypothetical protein
MTMRMLVGRQAWLVTDQAAIGGPKSLDGPKFDLIAKIQMRKRPVSVIVVESFDEKPTDN